MNWNDLVIAVVGGDEREQEIARLAAETGAEVRAYGFPFGDLSGVTITSTLAEAIDGCSHLLLPIPGIATDGSIFAPAASEPVVIGVELLRTMRGGGQIILGAADAQLKAAALELGITIHEYEHDQELMLLRAPAIVEGAIRIAIENTRFTLDANRAIVVGYGNIGARLAITLAALGARVTVAARNPVQRAAAYAAHLDSIPLNELAAAAVGLPMIFSTVPAPVVDRAVLSVLAPGALVTDLAAPPGGVDLDVARELGHTAVWARGLGRRAPITVGRSQWNGIRNTIDATKGSGK
jgi:dipicolinate synthase subunit A